MNKNYWEPKYPKCNSVIKYCTLDHMVSDIFLSDLLLDVMGIKQMMHNTTRMSGK